MGNINNSNPLFLKSPDHLKQRLYLPLRKRGCGLIHNQKFHIKGAGFCNFHHLLLSNGQAADHSSRIHIQPHHFQPLTRLRIHFSFIHHAGCLSLPAQKDIFSY